MMPTTKPTGKAAPILMAAEENQIAAADYSGYFQELCGLGMDTALDLQKTSMAAAVCMHSCAINIYKNASCLAPEAGAYLDMSAKVFALCMEMQSCWLTMLSPLSTWEGVYGIQAAPSEEEMAEHMDIACGLKPSAAGRRIKSRLGIHSMRAKEGPESGMDRAIGTRVA
jgi:hypothetical protein